jgi:hypothetical protein
MVTPQIRVSFWGATQPAKQRTNNVAATARQRILVNFFIVFSSFHFVFTLA